MRRLPLLLRCLAATLFLSSASASAESLLVFAASSTTEAMEALAHEFQAQSGVTVELAFGGSSMLARQIAAGAPADIFLAADGRSMDAVEHAGQVAPGTRRNLISNRLVIVVRRDRGEELQGPADLLHVGRLSLADPAAVPAGVYAREWLEGRKLWEPLSGRVLPSLDVRAALAAVQTGAADAAIVYQTDARVAPDVRVAYRVPLAETPAIVYPIARLRHAHGAAAHAFLDFLGSPRARAEFTRRGFLGVAPP